eukprot:581923-Prorocentrum_minimum.AAC.2
MRAGDNTTGSNLYLYGSGSEPRGSCKRCYRQSETCVVRANATGNRDAYAHEVLAWGLFPIPGAAV